MALLRWFNAREEARKLQARQNGYNYAAGQLLKSGNTPEVASRLEEESNCAFDHNDFDRGMQDALFDWSQCFPH